MVRKKLLIIRNNVFEELDEQLNYFINNDSAEYALRFANDFVQQLQGILPHYRSFPECRYLLTKKRTYRNIVWGNYWIIYKITPHAIEVLSLFHTKRNPSRLSRLRRLK